MSKTLTRAHLTDAVFDRLGLSRHDSADLVEAVLGEISDQIVAGNTVKISSFGSFIVRHKNGRMGRNPKTGQEVPIDPRRVVIFRPSQVMKDYVDHGNKK